MLGSAVVRQLRARKVEQVFQGPKVQWGQASTRHTLGLGLDRLLRESAGGPWQILWCAGSGVTASSPSVLRTEFQLFHDFLEDIARRPESERARGSLFFASSAGAAYGGSSNPPFDEQSIPAPLGEYGTAKLRAERQLEKFSISTGIPVLIGQIANLYGPGQSLAKQQGLISQLCRANLMGLPVSIFVSLDTRRDYFYIDDCAALIVAACHRLQRMQGSAQTVRKILASGRSVTIASLLGEFKQVAGKRPLIVTSSSRSTSLQGRDLRLTSRIWTDLDRTQKTPLVVGIGQTLADLSLQLNQFGARSMR